MKDAFSQPQSTRSGCQHMMGCKCDAPFHLRASTPVERRKEQRLPPPSDKEQLYLTLLLKIRDRSIPQTLRLEIDRLLSQP